jgi:hypothetical protein
MMKNGVSFFLYLFIPETYLILLMKYIYILLYPIKFSPKNHGWFCNPPVPRHLASDMTSSQASPAQLKKNSVAGFLNGFMQGLGLL